MTFGMPEIPTLLVIDDDPRHIDIFIDASQSATNEPFEIECVKTIAEGIKRSKRTEIRAIFISLSVLYCHPLEMFEKISLAVPNVSILVMAGARDAENGLAVLQLGAGGHLLADHPHRDSLLRTIRKMAARTFADAALFTAEKRIQITLDSIGDTALNTQIQFRIASISIVAGKSLCTQHYCTGSAVQDP
jgi:DNA-binding NarL/FixJ family response regulator